MKEHTIKAIPTMYNGVQFRSRLEATWAAFFDLCGWDWDYEPIDFNGWIPDFVLKGKINVYVEVQPFTKLEEFNKTIKKIIKTWIKEHVLLLGTSPFIDEKYNKYPCLGWCNEKSSIDYMDKNHQVHLSFGMGYYEPALFSDHGNWNTSKYAKQFKYQYDYYNAVMSYEQRLNQMHDGDHYNNNADPLPLWKQAKNITQWNKRSGSK